MQESILNRYELAKLLIEYGADVNLVVNRNYLILRMMERFNDELYSDEEAILNLELLIEHGSILIDDRDNTILMLTSLSNRVAVVEYLINLNQFDVNPKNNIGNTALIYATKKNNIDVVRLLLEHGAKKELVDNLGYTALNYAIENGFEEIISL